MRKYTIMLFFITAFSIMVLAQPLIFIKISGNTNIPTAFILSKMQSVKIGQMINRDTLYKALQNLYDTGFFSYIEPKLIPSDGDVGLLVNVVENPVVKNVKVTIDGPDLIGKKKVEKAILVKKGEVLNLNDLKKTFQSIVKLYTDKGYIPNVVAVNTNITQKTNSLEIPNGDLVINVKEYAIWTVDITGEHGKLTPQKLINTSGLFTLKSYENLNPLIKFFVDFKQAYPKFSEIQAFQSKIAQMGYFSPQTSLSFVPATDVSKDFKYPAMNIVVNSVLKKVVKSGLPVQQYYFSGVTKVNPFALEKYAGISVPSTTNNFEQLSQLARIRSFYRSKGYLLTGTYLKYYRYKLISNNGVLEYKVIQRHVGKIEIVGNIKTKKYLIERELQFKSGAPLTAQTLIQSYDNLKNTGFFSDVSIYPVLSSSDSSAVNVVVKVVENDKPRKLGGALTFGQPKEGQPWYSGIVASGNYAISDWAGYGQNVSANLNLGEESNFNLDYSVIFPFDLPVNFKSSLYYKTLEPFKVVNSQNLHYHENRTGISVSTGYQPNVHISFNIGGHYELFSRSPGSTQVDFGPASGTSREISLSFNYVNVDNVLLPMRGLKAALSGEIAGFGGEENYDSFTAMVSSYVPVFKSLSLAGRVLVGTAKGKDFYVGGPTTVRGWKATAGDQEFVSNISLRYSPDSNLPISFNAFYDWGGAKNNLLNDGNIYYDFMNSIGVGVAVDIPYMGVVRLDFPFKVDFNGKLEYSGITFGIGQMF